VALTAHSEVNYTMRRIVALFVLPLIATLALVGCGSSKPPSPNASVTAKGSFGSSPKVTIPKEKAGTTLAVKTLVQGKGATIKKTDLFLSNFTIYVWSGKTNKLLDSTYSSSPQVLPASLLPGIQSAVTGAKVGSRVLAVIPPKDGYGSSGNSELGVTGSDTLVFVMDLIQSYSSGTVGATGSQTYSGGGSLPTVSDAKGSAPKITIPKNVTPPKTLEAKTLIKGTGATVTKGEDVVAQYTGVNWRTGTVFDSSWSRSLPYSFKIGASPSQVIPGWDKGLVGQTVGSRVLLIIPPSDGYGSAGQSQAGIKGTDTLVFVVDIVGAVSPNATS
jgi:FKBP-type peptidyl-prolyl cis-trans isomerase